MEFGLKYTFKTSIYSREVTKRRIGMVDGANESSRTTNYKLSIEKIGVQKGVHAL